MKIKKIILILLISIFTISFNPNQVNAEVMADIGGTAAASKGNSIGGVSSGKYSLQLSSMVKASVVKVSNNGTALAKPHLIGSHFYMYYNPGADGNKTDDSYYKYLIYNNDQEANKVCGVIDNSVGAYTRGCVTVQEGTNLTIYTNYEQNWFVDKLYPMLNVSASRIMSRLSGTNTTLFSSIVNQINKNSGNRILNHDFDLTTITPAEKMKLQDYRLIIEPVYWFKVNNQKKYRVATIKGIAAEMVYLGYNNKGVGANRSALMNNIYATKQHGSIMHAEPDPNSLTYYHSLSDVNNGYGYGIFYIVPDECDPNVACCYDASGNYHKEYIGNNRNYSCSNPGSGNRCSSGLRACNIHPDTTETKRHASLSCDNTKISFYENFNFYLSPNELGTTEHDLNPGDTNYNTYALYENKRGAGYCTAELKIDIYATTVFNQTGTGAVNVDKGPLYSGGGFSFFTNYEGLLSYEFSSLNSVSASYLENHNSSARHSTYLNNYIGTKSPFIVVSEYEAVCPSGYTLVGSRCRKCIPTILGSICYYRNPTCTKRSHAVTLAQGSKEWNVVTQEMQRHVEKPEANLEVKTYESNTVTNTLDTMSGSWTEKYVADTNGDTTKWEPSEKLTYSLEYKLDKACIHRRTTKVRYIKEGNCTEDEIDGGYLYYTPLKYKDGLFPVKVNIADVNIRKWEQNTPAIWKVEYDCGIECQQKLYAEEGGFKFIYRPINMSNPFPTIVDGNKRIGTNWKNFMEDNDATESKLNRDTEEYEITLTPSNIDSIKNYNFGKNYTNLDTISNYGRSSFLTSYGITNLVNVNNFNKLGECSEDCWPRINSGDE